ncbi:hypothetical protein ACFL5T_03670 [Gemmatimonadota bacterium]
MRARKVLPAVALLSGGAVTLAGVASVAGYFVWAVIARWGEPDQSLLFWYLPFLLLGLAGVSVGLTAGVWGWIRLRRTNRQAVSE